MKSDGLQARIQHGVAELRAAYPRVSSCRASLEDWQEGLSARYALRLDIRWPQHQTLLSGPPCASAAQAVEAAFEKAARALGETRA